MINNIKNKQGGFLQLIIFIIIVLISMKYFHLTITDIINWVKALFNSVV